LFCSWGAGPLSQQKKVKTIRPPDARKGYKRQITSLRALLGVGGGRRLLWKDHHLSNASDVVERVQP